MENPDRFSESLETIEKNANEGFNVNFDMKKGKKARNVNLKKIKKFTEKKFTGSGKINDMKNANNGI